MATKNPFDEYNTEDAAGKGNKNPLKNMRRNPNFELKIPTGGSVKGGAKREKEIDDFYKKIRGY